MPDEGIKLVEFGRLDSGGLRRRVRQGVGVRGHPVDDGLMHDAEVARDPAQAAPVHVHPRRLGAQRGGIAGWLGLRCLLAATPAAPVPLSAQHGLAILDSTNCTLTGGTSARALLYHTHQIATPPVTVDAALSVVIRYLQC